VVIRFPCSLITNTVTTKRFSRKPLRILHVIHDGGMTPPLHPADQWIHYPGMNTWRNSERRLPMVGCTYSSYWLKFTWLSSLVIFFNLRSFIMCGSSLTILWLVDLFVIHDWLNGKGRKHRTILTGYVRSDELSCATNEDKYYVGSDVLNSTVFWLVTSSTSEIHPRFGGTHRLQRFWQLSFLHFNPLT
jgi:hypothetical protein